MSMTEQRLSSAYPPVQPLHVVVLEGDAALRQQILLPTLRAHGFAAHGAGSTTEVYRHMLLRSFDIAVLGISLGGEDSLAVVQQLRAMSDIGIVVLTHDEDRQHHVHALRAGADICLTKPADVMVLAATLQSLARRLTAHMAGGAVHDHPIAASSRWRLETGGWRLVSPRGNAIQLTSAEQCLVTLLAKADGQPVPRDSLIRALSVQADEFDPHRLEMMVYRLRRKAFEQTGERLPLLTARGIGYLLSCEMDASTC